MLETLAKDMLAIGDSCLNDLSEQCVFFADSCDLFGRSFENFYRVNCKIVKQRDAYLWRGTTFAKGGLMMGV